MYLHIRAYKYVFSFIQIQLSFRHIVSQMNGISRMDNKKVQPSYHYET